MEQEREWVRNHRSAGYIAGRFQGEFAGKPREMIVLQTTKGIELVPVGSTLPLTKNDIISQTVLDLAPVIDAMLEGGLTLEDVERIWQAALQRKRETIERGTRIPPTQQ